MAQLTADGQRIVGNLAQKYGISTDAAQHMFVSVLNGNGSMAQFNHAELGGSGQWMRGGMTMVGDMFNHGLKMTVDGLCSEISNILSEQPGLLQTGSFQSQSQNSGNQYQGSGAPMGQSSLFEPDPESQWYPAELGTPNAVGSQNSVRYAYFAPMNRLAVKTGGEVWVYDTLNHQIGGFSQQQGGSGSITFTSQFGTVDLATLPVVSRNGERPAASAEETPTSQHPVPDHSSPASQFSSISSEEIFSAIERLGELKEKGILSEEEFVAKKADLLDRL